jgi:hypothetical protein
LNIQVAAKAPPFHRSLLRFLSPKVEASCRLTISLSCGWRHFPGVPDAEPGATTGVAGLGVDGRDWEAIDKVVGRKWGNSVEKSGMN